MKVKTIFASMFVLGLVSGSALAAQQRGDIAGLRARMHEGNHAVATKGASNWFSQHVSVNAQLMVDAGISDKTKIDPFNGRLGPNGLFMAGPAGSKSSSDLYLDDSNITVDITPSNWVNAHFEIAANDENNSTANNFATTGRIVDVDFLRLDEAYATIGDLNQSPFYVSAGRMFVPFGDYGNPNPLTDSLPQLLSQINATAVNVGYVQPCGFYASGYAFRGLLQRMTTVAGVTTNNHANVNNVGVDGGYDWGDGTGQVGFNLNGGWIRNIADSLGIGPAVIANNSTATVTNRVYRNAVGGLALSASGYWNNFDGGVSYVTALKKFNAADLMFRTATNGAQPGAAAIDVGYGFHMMGHENHLGFSYQMSRKSSALGMPKNRYLVDWRVGVFKNTNLEFQYYHDKDYSVGDGGTGMNSNTGKVRLAVGFL